MDESTMTVLIASIASAIALVIGAVLRPTYSFLSTLNKKTPEPAAPPVVVSPEDTGRFPSISPDGTGRNPVLGPDGQRLTYSQVQKMVDQLAELLIAQPATKGDVIDVSRELGTKLDKGMGELGQDVARLGQDVAQLGKDVGAVSQRLDDHIKSNGGPSAPARPAPRPVRIADGAK